jgi:HK97 family phage prohead protease
MNKIFNILAPIAKTLDKDGEMFIQGLASTDAIDRAGDIIARDAWTKNGGLDNFKNNPIILFNHDPNQPIGTATSIEVTERGLEIKARISKAAGKVYELIKDGVLGAFSVSFMIKDADYIEETGGLKIKDAELYENSVVSIPCNQTATFSLAKSFESDEDYEDFKKTFTNSVDPAGLDTSKEDNSSNIDGTTPAGTEKSVQMEKKMDKDTKTLDVDAIAQEAAEKAVVKLALRAAEDKATKAASDKAEADQADVIKNTVISAVKDNTETLMDDFRAQMTAKDADMADTMAKFEARMEEKAADITNIRNSKRTFDNRTEKGNLKGFGTEILAAHMLGIYTQKGWNTDFAGQLAEKAGIDYVADAPLLDQEIKDEIQKEMTRELKVATLFRHIPVNGAATVLPIQPDVGLASWQPTAAVAGNLENNPLTGHTAAQYEPGQVVLNAYRLISTSFMDNDVDEQVLINLMPMLVEGVARAHARSIERMCLTGDGKSTSLISGLSGFAATATEKIDIDGASPGTNEVKLTADALLGARQSMGKYGVSPTELAYIVSQQGYFDLLSDPLFQTLDEVGSDLAVRVTGSLGAVYGTPVIVSDEFPAIAAAAPAAFCVWKRNYVIPVLRDIKIEQDYEVMNQRRVIVASQSTGFEEIIAGDGAGIEPSVQVVYTA